MNKKARNSKSMGLQIYDPLVGVEIPVFGITCTLSGIGGAPTFATKKKQAVRSQGKRVCDEKMCVARQSVRWEKVHSKEMCAPPLRQPSLVPFLRIEFLLKNEFVFLSSASYIYIGGFCDAH